MISANIGKDVRRKVYRRDDFQCALCGDVRHLQIHHIIPRSIGGSDFPENLVTLCAQCHAIAHGVTFPYLPDYMNREWAEQAIVEYVSDYYAERGEEWYPWK